MLTTALCPGHTTRRSDGLHLQFAVAVRQFGVGSFRLSFFFSAFVCVSTISSCSELLIRSLSVTLRVINTNRYYKKPHEPFLERISGKGGRHGRHLAVDRHQLEIEKTTRRKSTRERLWRAWIFVRGPVFDARTFHLDDDDDDGHDASTEDRRHLFQQHEPQHGGPQLPQVADSFSRGVFFFVPLAG